MRALFLVATGFWLSVCACRVKADDTSATVFVFGDVPLQQGERRVLPEMEYTAERGFGFEPGHPVNPVGGGVTGEAFFFSADLPEGNYRVCATLVGAPGGSRVTVKSELRRLSVEALPLREGEMKQCSFIVNTRTPLIAARNGMTAGRVRLKSPRESTREAWAWDGRLTLEFSGQHPVLSKIVIQSAIVPTIFLLGDSTVCDQSAEPYASWGQMFPRFFNDQIAVANHGESGETYRDSLSRRRIDKIMSVMHRGDWVLLQFGHNDQKQIAAGTGGPFTTYKEEIARHIALVRQAGGVPVIVSPMERRNFDASGKIVPSLADYAQAAGDAAKAAEVPLIDLHAMSIRLYEALGPEKCALAFAAPANGPVERTHHNNFGAYELAKCVAVSARQLQLGFASFLVEDFPKFSPEQPDDPQDFQLPATPLITNVRPLGD